MPGTRNDKDSDAGALFPPSFPGYCGHFGEGKPTSPTVPPLQHAGNLACSEQEALCHHPVRQGRGKEAKADGGGVTTGELREGLSGLW